MNADLYGCFNVPTGAQNRQTGVNINCNWAGTSRLAPVGLGGWLWTQILIFPPDLPLWTLSNVALMEGCLLPDLSPALPPRVPPFCLCSSWALVSSSLAVSCSGASLFSDLMSLCALHLSPKRRRCGEALLVRWFL